jgi:hypothetical protein
LRPQLRQVRRNINDDFLGRARGHVQMFQTPAGFVNDAGTVCAGGPNIPGRLVADLVQLAICRVLAEQVEDFFLAIGQKIELAVHPQWIEISRTRAGHGSDFSPCCIHDLDRRRGAATIAFPA